MSSAPRSEAPFRPRRARAVGLVCAALLLLVMLVVSVLLSRSPDSGWTGVDTASALVFTALVSGVLVRLVSVRALPTADALVVRNVVFTRRVDWGAVVAVRFGGADPWLTLDTDDGENVPVMAVQRADGEFAHREARRLARMVQERTGRAPAA